MQKKIDEFQPRLVILDPITNLIAVATEFEVKSMLVRLIDYLKRQHITVLFTSLTQAGGNDIDTEVGVSSLMDTWLLVRNLESNGERNRGLYVLKSRGMPHSNQVREFSLTDHGIELLDVFTSPHGILTGTERVDYIAQQHAQEQLHQQEIELKQRSLERRRKTLENQIAVLQAELVAEKEELQFALAQDALRRKEQLNRADQIAAARQADAGLDLRNNDPSHDSEGRDGH
jgi:circadian clock protein KaiC